MNKKENIELDFIIDELTHSIKNVVTNDSFQTEISRVTKNDLKVITKNNKWLFNWKQELKQPERDIYKLTIVNNPRIIQGLIMHLVESAPFNKGKRKMYSGVPGNLVAYACKLSFQRGHEGNVAFISKTQLIDHYIENLGAIHFGGRLMIIDTKSGLELVNKYYSNLI